MTPLSALLNPENVLLGIAASSKKRIFELASQTLSLLYGLDKREIFDGLNARERLGSTYLGNGFAIPHCRLPEIDSPKALFIRLNSTLDNGPEIEPTRKFFFLIAPENSCQEHLEILAQAVELFSDKTEVDRLAETTTSEQFCKIVSDWCKQHPKLDS